jgi:hypothetical protein
MPITFSGRNVVIEGYIGTMIGPDLGEYSVVTHTTDGRVVVLVTYDGEYNGRSAEMRALLHADKLRRCMEAFI